VENGLVQIDPVELKKRGMRKGGRIYKAGENEALGNGKSI
jgi:hypothetical protein